MSKAFTQSLGAFTRSVSGRTTRASIPMEFWTGLSSLVVEQLADDWDRTTETYKNARHAAYFSAEFLMGRALLNNLVNLGLLDEARDALISYGQDLTEILEQEHDAALGNGGLGRLAACFLDSTATLNLPVTGYGILYRYGLFKQTIEDGAQQENPDPWMEEGYPFLIRREESARYVHFADMDVRAVPYDMPITGYGTRNVNTLRLWKSEPIRDFDYEAFNSQRFTDAIVERERVNDLCRVLYPNDTTYEGKVLRVRQQYFFVSASLQSMLRIYLRTQAGLENFDDDGRPLNAEGELSEKLAQRAREALKGFSEFNSIQLNDTHPVLAVPELMRLLMDVYGMEWDDAWEQVQGTFAYTNHTVLAEALETWEVSIFAQLFPRILEIVTEIDRRFRLELEAGGWHPSKIDYMAPLRDGRVHMAWIACYAAYSINGVAELHTEIIKRDTLHDWHDIWPEKFNNKTNGVTQRRWLNTCNPRLAELLTSVVGSDEWVTDLSVLEKYVDRADDMGIRQALADIKQANKERFAMWIRERDGIEIPTNAIYDVQIKRLHEYKRQLLNAFYILDLYFRLKDNPALDIAPRVFIFGAKAASGYRRAKAIIKFINEVGRLINNDPAMEGRLTVLFVENYNVTPAEYIIPAADISEQISTAGKEASGTSNMKFMMNGALTLGTLDGANVEINEAVGEGNAYIFGAKEEELNEIRQSYQPREAYESVEGLKRVVDAMIDGTLDDGGNGDFHDLRASLLDGSSWESPDVYYVLGDFESYRHMRDAMALDWRDQDDWQRKAWINICNSGRFSSDRTINDYAEDVWKLQPHAI
ncbi:MAG: glycogen/starch/alpha-glucan phosphorylase [Actinomycetaceae bacterium]|nr:glycogen/starch/alpha-glucan phosphorylase [Actinomycetaceae bacterium]